MSTSRFMKLNALYCAVDYLIDHSAMALYIAQVKISKLTKDIDFSE